MAAPIGSVAAAVADAPDLMPVAVLLDELKHEDLQVRLASVRQLSTIAVALGPERTRDELIPFLTESTDDDDEVILALAVQLGRFIPYVGGQEHAYVLLAPLEMLAAVEESTVREKAVAALCAVAQAMPAAHVRDFLWPLAHRFGRHDWFTSRAASCGLLPRLYAALPSRAGHKGAGAAAAVAEGKDADGSAADVDLAAVVSDAAAGAAPDVADATREAALALYARLTADEIPMVRRAASAVFGEMGSAVAGGSLPDAAAALREGPVAGPQEPERAPAGGAGSAAAAGADPRDTGVVGGRAGGSGAGSAAGSGSGAASGAHSHDGLNVDTGDMTAAAVPPPVPRAVTVTASSPEAGAGAVKALLPVLVAVARDDQDSIRLLAVDNCVALARLLNGGMLSVTDGAPEGARALAVNADLRRLLLDLIGTLANDRAWRVRWSVANRLGELAGAFGAAVTTERLLPAFEGLLGDPEAEVRTAAAYRVSDIGRLAGKAKIAAVIMPCVERLAGDPSEHVRAALASVMLGLAPVLQHDATIESLLPLFLRLLKDSSPQVRLNIISKLEAVNAVIGLKVLSQSLLPAIAELSSDKQWRVRLAIIEFMPLLGGQLGADFFAAELTDLCVRWLTDPVFAIREAAAVNLRKLAEVFGPGWAEARVIPRVIALKDGGGEAAGLFAPDTSPYMLRMTSFTAAVTLGAAVAPATLQGTLLPFILSFCSDPVPNLRFNVAKSLERLASRVDAPVRAASIRPALERLAADGEEDVRYYAARALANVG